MSNQPKKEIKHLPITNAQAESLLKCIPAGWHLLFCRPLLRPDILEIKIVRPDHLAFSAKTTGAILLENNGNDFMEIIFEGVAKLIKAKKS